MKRTALLIATALLASPVFAADLCDSNIQKIDDAVKTNVTTSDTTPRQDQVMRLQEKAIQAKAAGDIQTCIATSGEALKLLMKSGDLGG
ncbi:hypothetical protein D3880_18010 [Pseudomonas cavernae]|uniref:Secreted protein n=1 Tax=Pseudomonas cavernae TaxID=2320867 RepID=A0A385Z6K3_9PSED|nr:hypothetical protein [Pseudomonas cavernae]AYC34140.1 hypothetical protein D3880_18010 [Pseudomonas cavernae]